MISFTATFSRKRPPYYYYTVKYRHDARALALLDAWEIGYQIGPQAGRSTLLARLGYARAPYGAPESFLFYLFIV